MTALHHETAGPPQAPVLLMGGSLGTRLRMWDPQLPLAGALRLVRLDHRGHGDSPVPPAPYELGDLGGDVLELMDALGLERASYCGLSLGGMVGMWLAINAPERIDRLVLLCTSAYMPPASMWQERIRIVLDAGSVEPLADAVIDRWLTPEFAAAERDTTASIRQMLVSTPAEGYAGCCAAIERMDLRGSLPSIRAPTLVISGDRDPATPVSDQQQIARAIPRARHEVVSPASHLATVEQAEQINRLIQEHLS